MYNAFRLILPPQDRLEEWNDAKEIPNEQLYKGLDTRRKELILSQVAYENFIDNQQEV